MILKLRALLYSRQFSKNFIMASSDISSAARRTELAENLADIRQRVLAASSASSSQPTLVAVSKYKPGSDIKSCYDDGQLDFGENYVQELVDKAASLPTDIRWHFIGHLQSNKAKVVAAISNLHCLHTLSSTKTASLLQKSLPEDRSSKPLNVLIQVNTSGEDAKSGLPPLTASSVETADSEVAQLAIHVIEQCPSLRLEGLMTIGSLEASHSEGENPDFETLKTTRDILANFLSSKYPDTSQKWGNQGKLLLSMGMSSDFEEAIRAGSDLARVGTGIFGSRKTKEEVKAAQ
ncbi:hypothetical protein DL96DRAFT_1587540 [Flagelloscypha sp. PMI_526]|nr:hypothetical protein DL96DRAFT_1587540 [Flagelloscypha sp. PMI_526]